MCNAWTFRRRAFSTPSAELTFTTLVLKPVDLMPKNLYNLPNLGLKPTDRSYTNYGSKDMISEDRLKNWAFYCAWGHVGPEHRTQCASAEGNYESEDVFEGEEPRIEPDMIDGQAVEDAVRELPDVSRRVLKARYIQYPYNLSHNVAQRLRMSTDKLEAELHIAKRRLHDRLQRNSPRFTGMAGSEAGVCNSQQG